MPKKRWNWLELGVMLFGGPWGAVQQRAPVGGGVRACFAVPLYCCVLLHREKDS